MPTQVQRTAAARRRLIAATRELVAAQGVSNTSVAAIGELAGMSRGAVNFHFGSKDDLLVAVVQQVTSDWERQAIGSATEPVDPADIDVLIDLLLGAWLGELGHNPERVRIAVMLLFEALGPSPHLHDHFVDLSARVRERVSVHLAHLRSEGAINAEIDADAFATLLLGVLAGIAVVALLDPATAELDRTIAEARATLLARLHA
jgi:AcrR family transcriptional regulator